MATAAFSLQLAARRVGLVAILAFGMSTQLLFQPGLFEDWGPAQVFTGWLEQFLDALAMGACMLAAVWFVDALAPQDAWWRLAALTLAVVVGAAVGMAGLTA